MKRGSTRELLAEAANQATFIASPVEAPIKVGVEDKPISNTPDALAINEPILYADDPRPDITDDHALWNDLLTRAEAIDGRSPDGLFGALHGLRCLGARLVPVPTGGVRLERGEIPEEAKAIEDGKIVDRGYKGLRKKWLLPHAEALMKLLSEVGT